MAVFFGGMSAAQTQHPTDAMMRSGRVLIVRRTNIFRPPDHEHITVNPSRT
jgi:thymidine phosphorylase